MWCSYLSLSKVAKLPGYTKPVYHDDEQGGRKRRLSVVGGRHPVLEQVS